MANGTEEVTRGRTTSRDGVNDDGETAGGANGGESRADKRRRSRKGLDKKFTCPTDGCGKQYSRAEHLYRHQLNHSPKAIYRCDFPGCPKHFVRQDLCVRHRERHATRTQNSASRRESYAGNGLTPAPETAPLGLIPSPDIPSPIHTPQPLVPNRRKRASTPDLSTTVTIKEESGRAKMRRTSSDHASISKGQAVRHQHPIIKQEQLSSNVLDGPFHPPPMVPKSRSMSNPNMQQAYTTQPAPLTSPLAIQTPMSMVSTFPHQTAAPEPQYMTLQEHHIPFPMSAAEYTQHTLVTSSSILSTLPTAPANSYYYEYPQPVITHIFDDSPQNPFSRSPTNNYNTRAANDVSGWFESPFDDLSATSSNYSVDNEQFDATAETNQMHVRNFLNPETPVQAYEISEAKKQRVMNLLNIGQLDNGTLTRKKMQEYIKNYWKHFHPQLPILHRPTWRAEEAHDALVGAVMMTGMLAVDPNKESKESALRVAQAISSSVRWSAFADADFDPPAKLWVFQALLILELFEKLFVTRIHHERAHVHHATTLTLMRRGTSFVDVTPGSNGESPPRDGMGSNDDRAEENAWRKWIHAEEVRRVAFAAFIVDASHAAMFGHAHHLIATELKITLPCDERLWEATSAGEKKQHEKQSGCRSISFGDAVRYYLNGKAVKTTAFGRTCLMAGLLGLILVISTQENSVDQLLDDVPKSSNESRRRQLAKAVDFWKEDYEKYVQEGNRAAPTTADVQYEREQRSRLAQHALAHLALNVDVIDLQIYAGAFKLLGRAVVQTDRDKVQDKMKKWAANNSKANDAVWHALKFIRSVMTEDYAGSRPYGMRRDSAQTPFLYDPNEDNLYHRPWILYFAALTIFAYALAKEGPRPATEFKPIETMQINDQITEMHSFLNRLDGISVQDLAGVQNMTQCGSLLLVLAKCFDNCRWELLREGAKTLRNSYRILHSQPPHHPDYAASQISTTPN
ncbi:hypothetical protein BJ508DRAFT_324378 [Ascobolus immersus RN42]|uniref:C2H2-type domain-containing protein n=1 Tax=Ascobolus immersus RN42 TaxID=1160509 RepID=A0A3N4IPX1_ASCIM|nr:hypothetical protein BJ508DRAFT_324378 [Ascobolus immersus RN42]